MKKFVLTLGLALIQLSWGWQGFSGLGAPRAYAQYPPPPGAYYCDPYSYQCTYNNYYSAPYADPLTQFFYYAVPQIGGELEERHERREFREHERFEHRRYEHERH